MADKSAIEWTDSTWNPVTGCTKVSRGCDNCYAERFAERFRGVEGHPFEMGFDLTLREERLGQPLRWRRPRQVFVNSMSDLFHKGVPWSFVDRVFDVMEQADWHVFQVLTKRSSLMRDYLRVRYSDSEVPSHIWCGVSVEDRNALVRVKHLQESPVTLRFLSMEPLLDSVGDFDVSGISWIIVGGESGPGARRLEEDWVCEVRDLCENNEIPFFFKQWEVCGPSPVAVNWRAWNTMECLSFRGGCDLPFNWVPGGPPPSIEEHSLAKLAVLRNYVSDYIDRLCEGSRRDVFKLDLVDGFSGGGLFLDGNREVSGTPLIMLEEAEAAYARLNERRVKPLRFDLKFHFVDIAQDHTRYLAQVLEDRIFDIPTHQVRVYESAFEDTVQAIITDIKRRQPRAGRALFLLDQKGFSQVELGLVRRIFNELAGAEVILTFAADFLINHLVERQELYTAVRPLELAEVDIRDLVELKHGTAARPSFSVC